MLSLLSYIYPFPLQTSLVLESRDSRAFPYDQPPATQLLVILSFIYILNVSRKVADFALHGGIIAEIAVGMVYGAPLANILAPSWQETFTVLGYLGLIGIV